MPPRTAAVFLHQWDGAKGYYRLANSFLPRHAATHVLLNLPVKMEVQFRVKFTL
jgi:hypothetical protein